MFRSKWVVAQIATFVPVCALVASNLAACGPKSQPPDELTSLSASPTQSATLEAPPTDSASASASTTGAKPPSGAPVSNIAACCQALANASTAQPQYAAQLKMAADYCNGAQKDPNSKQVLNQIASMLKGASLPTQCK